jgi:hypothetical protein
MPMYCKNSEEIKKKINSGGTKAVGGALFGLGQKKKGRFRYFIRADI